MIGKEVQAQEEEYEAPLMEEMEVEDMDEEAREAVLSVSAGMPAIEDTAEIMGIVSDEPLDEGQMAEYEEAAEDVSGEFEDMEEAVEDAGEEMAEEVDDEMSGEMPLDEDQDEMLQEGRGDVEKEIMESLMDDAVEREVASVLGAEEVAVRTEAAVSEKTWGFSVYDPADDSHQYYTGDGRPVNADSRMIAETDLESQGDV